MIWSKEKGSPESGRASGPSGTSGLIGKMRRNKSYHSDITSKKSQSWSSTRAIRYNFNSSSSKSLFTMQYIILLVFCSILTNYNVMGQQNPNYPQNPPPFGQFNQQIPQGAIAIPVPQGVNPQNVIPVPVPMNQFQNQQFDQNQFIPQQQQQQQQSYPQQQDQFFQNQQPQQFAQHPHQQFDQNPQQFSHNQQQFDQNQNQQFSQNQQQFDQNQNQQFIPQQQHFDQQNHQQFSQDQQPIPMSGPSGPGQLIPIPPLPQNQVQSLQIESSSDQNQNPNFVRKTGDTIPDQGFDHPFGDGSETSYAVQSDSGDEKGIFETSRGVMRNVMTRAKQAFKIPMQFVKVQAQQLATSGSNIVPQVIQTSFQNTLQTVGLQPASGSDSSANFHPVKMAQMHRPPPPPNFPLYDMPKEGFATPPPPPIMHPMANMPSTYYSTTNYNDEGPGSSQAAISRGGPSSDGHAPSHGHGHGHGPPKSKNRLGGEISRLGPFSHGGPRRKSRPGPPISFIMSGTPPGMAHLSPYAKHEGPPKGKKQRRRKLGKKRPSPSPKNTKNSHPPQPMTKINTFEGYDDPMASNIRAAISPPLGRPLGYEEYMKRPSHSFTQDPWNFDPLANELNQGMNTYGLKYNYDPLGMHVLEPGQTHLDETKPSYVGDFYTKEATNNAVPSAQIGGWNMGASSWDSQILMEREKNKPKSQSGDLYAGGSSDHYEYDRHPHKHQPSVDNRKLQEQQDQDFDPIAMLANAGIEIDLGDLTTSKSSKDRENRRKQQERYRDRESDRDRERERLRNRDREYRERENRDRERHSKDSRKNYENTDRHRASDSKSEPSSRREEYNVDRHKNRDKYSTYATRNPLTDSYSPYDDGSFTDEHPQSHGHSSSSSTTGTSSMSRDQDRRDQYRESSSSRYRDDEVRRDNLPRYSRGSGEVDRDTRDRDRYSVRERYVREKFRQRELERQQHRRFAKRGLPLPLAQVPAFVHKSNSKEVLVLQGILTPTQTPLTHPQLSRLFRRNARLIPHKINKRQDGKKSSREINLINQKNKLRLIQNLAKSLSAAAE